MNLLSEHKPFAVVSILQIALIIGGTLTTGAILKSHGYPDAPHFTWNPFSVWIRSYGAAFILIPIIWIVSALYYDTKSTHSYSRVTALGSGIVLIASLMVIYFLSSVFAVHTGLLVVPN